MSQNLGGLGQVNYNGIELTGPYARTKVSAVPEWSRSGRVIKWWRLTFRVSTFIASSGGNKTDSQLEHMRNLLTVPGQLLTYTGVGFGDPLSIGYNGRVRDLNYGPKPSLITFLTYGGTCAYVEFEVTACVGEQCFVTTAVPTDGTPLLLASDWSWETRIDQDGYTTVTWRITAEIPLWLKGDHTLYGVADQVRERVTPPLLTGFQRTTQDWTLSDDKRTLTGALTDVELALPLPDNVSFFDVDHDVYMSNSGPNSFWNGAVHTIRGTIHMPKGYVKADAWSRIYLLLADRLARALSRPEGYVLTTISPIMANPSPGPEQPGRRRMVYLLDFRLGEKVFGRETHFSLTYRQLGVSLGTIINTSGLWQPMAAANFSTWKRTMQQPGGPATPRGGSGLYYTPLMEGTVVDLCNQGGDGGSAKPPPTTIIPPPPPQLTPPGIGTVGIDTGGIVPGVGLGTTGISRLIDGFFPK